MRRSKNGTFLFLRGYMDYHRGRFQDHSLCVHEKGRLIAILPAHQEDNLLISHGGLTYGGFITDTTVRFPEMIDVFEAVLSYAQNAGFSGLSYKTTPYIYHKAPAGEDICALFMLKAAITRRFALAVIDNARKLPFQQRRVRAAGKAKKCGLKVMQSTDFKPYWKLLASVIGEKYKAQPVHTLDEISLLHSRFPDNIKLFACYKDKELAAGVVIYESDRVARAQYIAADGRGKESGALDLLFDFLLNGYYAQKPFFDFGTSEGKYAGSLNKGLIDQKEGFGARIITYDQYAVPLDSWRTGMLKGMLQ